MHLELAEGLGQPLFPGDQSPARREPVELGRDWPKAAALTSSLVKDKTLGQMVGLVILVLEGLGETGYTSPIYIWRWCTMEIHDVACYAVLYSQLFGVFFVR